MSSYLVTGASRGVGLELTKQLVALPTSDISIVFAVTRSPSQNLDEVIVNAAPGRVFNIVISNLQDLDDVQRGKAEVETKLAGKGLDVLVNNAGVAPATDGNKMENVLAEGRDSMKDVFSVNVVSPHVMIQCFLPLLRKGNGKKIVNISSELSSISRVKEYAAIPTHAYKISKAAVNMLTVLYATDLEAEGFTCFAMSPGWLKTDGGGPQADLEVPVGVNALKNAIVHAGSEKNGKFLSIHVPGQEVVQGPNVYDGAELPW